MIVSMVTVIVVGIGGIRRNNMKKLDSNADNWAIIGTINDLIDRVGALSKVITSDTIRITTDEVIKELSEDTHRTVTLRIPKNKTIAEAVAQASGFNSKSYFLPTDAEIKKALELL